MSIAFQVTAKLKLNFNSIWISLLKHEIDFVEK